MADYKVEFGVLQTKCKELTSEIVKISVGYDAIYDLSKSL